MEKQDELSDRMKKGDAIRSIVSNSSWKHIHDIFLKLYKESLDNRIKKDDVEDRLRLEIIEEIYRKITMGIKIGIEARKEYTEKFDIGGKEK